MDTLKELISLGEQLGYKDDELRDYVNDQQNRQREERAAIREKERQEREFQIEKERLEHDKELEKEKLDHEIKLKRLEDQHELEVLQLKSHVKTEFANVNETSVKASVPKIPPFDETKDEMDSYLRRFERYATTQKWDPSLWATHLSALLKGKALDVYALMPSEQSQNYKDLKLALLRRYNLTEDGFKQKFRSCRPEQSENFTQFTVRLASYLTRWIEMSKITKDFDGLFDLMLRDQLLHVCNQDLKIFLKQHVPKSVEEMCQLADQFKEARCSNAISLCSSKTRVVNKPSSEVSVNKSQVTQSEKHGMKSFVPMSERKCYKCGKQGHIATNCKSQYTSRYSSAVLGDNEEQEQETVQFGETSIKTCSTCIFTQNPAIFSPVSDNSTTLSSACHTNEKPMPLSAGYVEGKPVTMLRDTGCRNIVVRKSLVPDNKLTGKHETCILADSTKRLVSVAKVFIDTPYLTGEFEVWCMDNPVFDLIIGEVNQARKAHDPDRSWKPVLAVETRQQKKDKENKYLALKVPEIITREISPSEIHDEQQADPSLQTIRKFCEEGKISRDRKVTWIEKNGLLYRKYEVSQDEGKQFCQLIVPSKFRNIVMKLAHESIMSGHLATRRTIFRVLSEFFWPGVQSDIKRFCQSCDICQRTISKGKVSKVPLYKMPLIDEPFKRVAVDLVGPLHPPTDRGNRYILTLVDYATRYPEATALPTIDTERVAEALVEMFLRIGVPQEMLTDMGSQFTSSLLGEVSRLISLKQLTTTPYHPMCNGLVERFNGTLKQMLKRMCNDRPKDWDKYLPAVLFAYREVPNESLGFSPFELVYGRSVRGPMSILKELWTNTSSDSQVKSTYQYVLDLRERLESTCELAKQNLEKASGKHKVYYDRKARIRNMKEGDKVLILLPTDSNKLLMQWKGPFTITKKIGKVDYLVNVKGKTKTYHANLLKRYIDRNDENSFEICHNLVSAVPSATIDHDDETSDVEFFLEKSIETFADVNVNPDLTVENKEMVINLLKQFSDVISDKPGDTCVLQHDIKLSTDKLIRVSPRQIPYSMIDTVNDEVRNMLQMNIIEPSNSPYSSPIVLVKKKDNSYRFCIDFRLLNRITIFDAEPMPDSEAMFSKLTGHNYFSKLDLSKGYWQVPLTSNAKPLTAFQTPLGLFQFVKMPYGLVSAHASFCRLMRKVLDNMSNVDNFIDDILVFTMTFDEHITVLTELFQRLRNANLTAKPSKCFIAHHKLEYLGHMVGEKMIQPNPDKVKSITEASPPTTKKQLRSFLGLVGFYRKFIPNFAHIALPLTDLTRKYSPNKLVWSESQEIAFQNLKMLLTKSPILKLPNINDTFILQTDASDRGIGGILLQREGNQKLQFAYVSRKLKQNEEHFARIEKECLAIIWSIQKFHRYLYGREFILETDHQPLVYLNKTKMTNSRLMRWALHLQPYRFHIEAIKGRDNVGADYLSRI